MSKKPRTFQFTKQPANGKFCCDDCGNPWKEGQTVRVVLTNLDEKLREMGVTDDICNNCYTKRLQDRKL